MKDKIVSILILLVIIIFVVLSLDVFGIITLPAKISLRTYLPNSVEVASLGGKDEVYYPDYNAIGIQTLQKSTSNTNKGPVDMSNIISSNETGETGFENNITDNSFYYNQLDLYGKTIYSKLYANLDNLKTGEYVVDFGTTFNDLLQNEDGNAKLTDSFQLSINALLLDHPEIFYLDITKMYLFTKSTSTIRGTTYRISIGPDEGNKYLLEGFNSKSDVLIAEDELNTILYSIKERVSGNIVEQIRQVHNMIIDSVDYDSDSKSDLSHGIYGALVNKLAVCDGYAKTFKYILDNLGISCVEVCGVAKNSSGETESHAWNDVLINGSWYAIDVTWDDPIIIGGSGILSDDLRYTYFLKGSDTFYTHHQEDGNIVSNGTFEYPILNGNGMY